VTTLYFAYGSNLPAARLQARCPGATPLGPASLPEYRMAFPLSSRHDGSGKAGIISAPDERVWGRLYQMALQEIPELDQIEGLNYERCDVTVHTQTGTERAFTYIPKRQGEDDTPFDWYLALILWGAKEAGAPNDVQTELRTTPWRADPDQSREGFRAARSAFEASGITDWRQVLG